MNQVERLELQRTKLRKQLDKTESFQEKNTIEKFIFDIDMKIANLQIRLVEATNNIRRKTADGINQWYEKEQRHEIMLNRKSSLFS